MPARGLSYSNQPGSVYPSGIPNSHGEENEQATPRTMPSNPPVPSPDTPIREPWGYRMLPDAQYQYHSFGNLPSQDPGAMMQHPQYQQQVPYSNQPQTYSPPDSNSPQHRYTVGPSLTPYPQMNRFESGHADRHLPSQASYNTTPGLQVHESYAHPASHLSPITAGEADSLADDFHNRLRLPSDGSHRKGRQSHHPDAPGRGYDNQVEHSLGRSKDKKKPTLNRHHTRGESLGKRHNSETIDNREGLDSRYEVQDEKYFKVGRVFKVLWHQNAGSRGSHRSSEMTRGKFGELIYSNPRRMVVVRNYHGYSWCLPIYTYGGNGVAKRGINPSSHAVIYSAGEIPCTSSKEPPMTKEPLAAETFPDQKLDPMSRINFGKIHTVEHNEKVCPIGKIAKESLPKFKQYADEVMRDLE